MKKLITLAAIAALAFSAQTATADITFDLSGVTYDGASLPPFVMAGNAGEVTGISFDFEINPIAPSWSEELELIITAADGTLFRSGSENSGDGPFDFDFGAPDNSTAPFAFVGDSDFLNGDYAAGDWSLTVVDNFDDAGPDGSFSAGSTVTVNYAAKVPEPASAAIISMIGLGLVVRRRR